MKIQDMSTKDMKVLESEWQARLEPSKVPTVEPVALKPKPKRPNTN